HQHFSGYHYVTSLFVRYPPLPGRPHRESGVSRSCVNKQPGIYEETVKVSHAEQKYSDYRG
ncbi:hypothetical protein V9723_29075, partial [Klebsiella pneumoniae]|uniref:hypothetical protein n=1 Tax=Klebsiella pneumoniae TaxID=573 RepID=UPI00300FF8A5